MKRILSVAAIALVLAAMVVVTAMPALADSTRLCNNRCGTDNDTTVTSNTTTNTTTNTTANNTTNSTTKSLTCGNLPQGSTCTLN